jgi:serine/threonine protein phosphatase PrpC
MRLEIGVATLPLPGQLESGDLSLVKKVGKGTLVAVVDGLGHGQEAASAAQAAVTALDRYSKEPLPELVKRCHTAMMGLRGVVLGVAYFDPQANTMTWLGVGNVGGVLMRKDQTSRPARVSLVPMAGFIGSELHNATARAVPLTAGDIVVLYSDGIKDGFAESLVLSHTPQEIADYIIHRHIKGTDDALALVVRYGV